MTRNVNISAFGPEQNIIFACHMRHVLVAYLCIYIYIYVSRVEFILCMQCAVLCQRGGFAKITRSFHIPLPFRAHSARHTYLVDSHQLRAGWLAVEHKFAYIMDSACRRHNSGVVERLRMAGHCVVGLRWKVESIGIWMVHAYHVKNSLKMENIVYLDGWPFLVCWYLSSCSEYIY